MQAPEIGLSLHYRISAQLGTGRNQTRMQGSSVTHLRPKSLTPNLFSLKEERTGTWNTSGFKINLSLRQTYLSKNNVSAIQPRTRNGGDKELGRVRVWARVCHRQQSRRIMLQYKVLVLKSGSVDRLPSCAIARRYVASLTHKLRNDPVELTALIVQIHTGRAPSLLARAKGPEILRRERSNLREQLKHDSPSRSPSDGNIKKHVDALLHLSPYTAWTRVQTRIRLALYLQPCLHCINQHLASRKFAQTTSLLLMFPFPLQPCANRCLSP